MPGARHYDISSTFLRAKECPDCGHTLCGESCACNCDAGRAEHAAAALLTQRDELAAALRMAIAWEEKTRARLGLPQVDAPDWARAAQAALARATGEKP